MSCIARQAFNHGVAHLKHDQDACAGGGWCDEHCLPRVRFTPIDVDRPLEEQVRTFICRVQASCGVGPPSLIPLHTRG